MSTTNPDLSLSKNTVRKFALVVLDDQQGINFHAMELLSTLLVETDNEDVLEHVTVVKEERAFIDEDYAEEELTKLSNEENNNISTDVEEA